jgi:hypothetical protein
MEKCKVWSLIDKNEIKERIKLIGSKWVFLQKRDGTFRARLVPLGHSQIAGIDFSNHHSPV